MPLLYGEGELKAFQRLQYEIVRSRRDESILAWSRPVKKTEILPASILPSSTSTGDLDYVAAPAPGLLAPSPKYFSNLGDIISIPPM